MPHSPSTFAQRPAPHTADVADAETARSRWLRALRAVGVAALVIAALFVSTGFLLLPVVPV